MELDPVEKTMEHLCIILDNIDKSQVNKEALNEAARQVMQFGMRWRFWMADPSKPFPTVTYNGGP